MVEEGQARLKLPVVVKEGQLTQRVVLLVTINDRTTTGNANIYNDGLQSKVSAFHRGFHSLLIHSWDGLSGV